MLKKFEKSLKMHEVELMVLRRKSQRALVKVRKLIGETMEFFHVILNDFSCVSSTRMIRMFTRRN